MNTKGFSLLEVMLALGVITIGLMGVSSLVLQNIQAQDINKNYLIASMLAQEGLELVRNVRDTNFLNYYDWKAGNSSNTNIVRGAVIDGTPKEYAINYDETIRDVTTGMNDDKTQLYIFNNKYDHAGVNGILTPYRRLIKVYNRDYYLEVHSNVQWSEHGRIHNYEAVTDLYIWW